MGLQCFFMESETVGSPEFKCKQYEMKIKLNEMKRERIVNEWAASALIDRAMNYVQAKQFSLFVFALIFLARSSHTTHSSTSFLYFHFSNQKQS